MRRVVFLLEEPSMKAFLEEFLPRAWPGLEFLCLKHEGKQDLDRSIPRKLRAWGDPGARFVILRDNDGADCKRVKARLRALCDQGRQPGTLIRIACQELEAWHLGSLEALSEAYAMPQLVAKKRKAKYANPDALANPAEELHRLIPEFRKLDGARRMGRILTTDLAQNRSHSFRVFMAGLRRYLAA